MIIHAMIYAHTHVHTYTQSVTCLKCEPRQDLFLDLILMQNNYTIETNSGFQKSKYRNIDHNCLIT